MPEINEIYKFMKANSLTDKDEKTFLNEYSNPQKAKEVYSFFKENNLTDRDETSFYDTYLKKKEPAPSQSLGGELLSKFTKEKSPYLKGLDFRSVTDAIKADKDKNNSLVGGLYNSLVGVASDLAGGLAYSGGVTVSPFVDLAAFSSGYTLENGGTREGFRNIGDKFPEQLRKSATSLVEKARTESSSRENEQRRGNFDVSNGVFNMQNLSALGFQFPQTALGMGAAALTGGASFLVQGIGSAAKELEETPDADKLTQNQKLGYIATQALVNAALEKVGFDKIFKSTGITKKVQQKITNEITQDFIKKGIKATASEIEQEALKRATKLATKIKSVGLKAATSFAVEGGTEAAQSGASDAIKYITNKASGKDVFDEEDIKKNFFKNMINQGLAGGVTGGVMGGFSSALQNTNKAIRNEISNAQTPEDIEKVRQSIAEQVELGNITPEEAEAAGIKAQQYAEIAAKIPSEIDAEKKYAIIGGIEQREALKKEIETTNKDLAEIDPAFQEDNKNKLILLEAKLEQTNDYINDIVTGKKTKYVKDGDKYYKLDANGEEIKITKEYYDLATAIKEEDKVKKGEQIQSEQDKKEIEENRRLDNEEIDAEIANLDTTDLMYDVKKQKLEQRRAKQNDYYNSILGIKEEPLVAEAEIKTPQVEEQNIEVQQPEEIAVNTIETVSEVKPTTEESYQGVFNDKKTGVGGLDELLEDDGYNFFYKGVQGKVEMMSPDEYLQRVRKGFKEDKDVNITESKKEAIKKAIENGDKINMPYLSTKDGKFSQEGRNRAVVAKELGEEKIPVLVESDVTFEDKINKGKEYVDNAIKEGAKTKDEVLSNLKEKGIHRDGIYFIDNNFDEIAPKIETPIKEEVKVEAKAETPKEQVKPIESKPTKEGKQPTDEGLRRAEAKKVHARVSSMEAPVNDARQIALRYIADGFEKKGSGGFGKDAIEEIAGHVKRARLNTGGKEKLSQEVKDRDYYNPNEKRTLDQIAHDLWERSDQEVSERDIKDALMEAAREHNTRLDAGKAYLERYNEDYAEEQHFARIAEERAEEFDKELKDIEDWLKDEGEKTHPIEAEEEHINNLIKQYEAEFKAEDKQPTLASEGQVAETPSSRTSGEEAKVEKTVADQYEAIKEIKSKKAQEKAKEKLINDNFESIVSQLMLKNKIKRIC